MERLLQDIKNCKVCERHLAHGVRPVMTASPQCKLIVIGQAPGRIVHHTGIPWNDKSGDNLRNWLGIDKEVFYNKQHIALMPMGFCYPGTGKTGDLPPRPECAPLWHHQVLSFIPNASLTLLIGAYAQNHYLGNKAKSTLTETVRHFNEYLPHYFPLPHPSPRNNIWQAKNEWFAEEVVPALRAQVHRVLFNI